MLQLLLSMLLLVIIAVIFLAVVEVAVLSVVIAVKLLLLFVKTVLTFKVGHNSRYLQFCSTFYTFKLLKLSSKHFC